MAVGDYPRDPSIPSGNGDHKIGPPPDGHVRRCQSKRHGHHAQCLKWALKGRDYCRTHGGRRLLYMANAGKMVGGNHNYIARNAGPRMQAKIEELAALPEKDFDLGDTSQVTAAMLSDCFTAYVAATESELTTPAVKAQAFELFTIMLKEHSDVCAKGAKIRSTLPHLVDLNTVRYVVAQVCKIIDQLFVGVVPTKTMQLAFDKFNEIRLPKDTKMSDFVGEPDEKFL